MCSPLDSVVNTSLSVFVENRVREVRTLPNATYCHVPGDQNPADLPSRGISAKDLSCLQLWWCGPDWLLQPESEWPSQQLLISPELQMDIDSEQRKSSVKPTTTLLSSDNSTSAVSCSLVSCLTRASTLRSATSTALLIFKFVNRAVWRKISTNSQERLCQPHPLFSKIMTALSTDSSASLLQRLALSSLVRSVQQTHFPDLMASSADDSKNKRPLQRQLGVQADPDGVLRCHGSLANMVTDDIAQHPVLLPHQDPLTSLIIQDTHRRLHHAGVSHTLCHLRRNFWVIRGRKAATYEVKRCVTCRRLEGPAFTRPAAPPLPVERVSQSQPFDFVGLDYLGPLHAATDQEASKVWVCLSTCFVTRAIHLELVPDQSTRQFLNCFCRFVARRGTPVTLYSDNASKLKLASSILDSSWEDAAQQQDVRAYLSFQGIQWKFIAALAPWQGGVYERLVGMVKRSLRKTLGRQHLPLEDLRTLIVETECILNSRPITHVTSDSEGPQQFAVSPLSPAHFLNCGKIMVSLPTTAADDDDDYQPQSSTVSEVSKRWQREEERLHKLWTVWKTEYLQFLRSRSITLKKPQHNTTPGTSNVGDVVIVEDPSLPRTFWKIGRVTALKQSDDDVVRSASVLLPSGNTVMRSISQLYPLEIASTLESEEPEKTTAEADSPPSSHRPRRAAADEANVKMVQASLLPAD